MLILHLTQSILKLKSIFIMIMFLNLSKLIYSGLFIAFNNSVKIAWLIGYINKSVGSGNTIGVSYTCPISFTQGYVAGTGSTSNEYSCYIHNVKIQNTKVSLQVKNDSGGSLTITSVRFIIIGF